MRVIVVASAVLIGAVQGVPRLAGTWLTLGDGVWQVYAMTLDGDRLTISGGDLEQPVTLRRVGAPTPRPDTLQIPEAPPPTSRAW